MNINRDKRYKVVQGRRNYYGTPEMIINEMSSWDRSRPEGDPARVTNNIEYIQLVLDRLFVEESKIIEINDECKLLSFLYDAHLIEVFEAN